MMTKHDSLRFNKSRLNAYKGLASESYICLESEDPFLTIFEMRTLLLEVATIEKHYRYILICTACTYLLMGLL